MRIHSVVLAVVPATLLLAPPGAMAGCVMTPGTGLGIPSSSPIVYYMPSFNATFDPGVPVGVGLVSRTMPVSSVGGTVTCSGFGIGYADYKGTTGAVGPYSAYPTSIPGVGIRIQALNSFDVVGWWPRSQDKGTQKTARLNPYATLMVELVKTGLITRGGRINGEVAAGFAQDGRVKFMSIRVTGDIVVEPRGPTCSVSTQSVSVPLGKFAAARFTGPGTTSPAQPFSIRLNCSGGAAGKATAIHMTLTDLTNPGNRTNVLSLALDSGAKGIGIQVLNGHTVLSYGPDSSTAGNVNQWKSGSVETGTATFDIPLAARFVQTGDSVTAGAAIGRASFTMSYQ